jgi:kinesin family member 6/9
VFKHLSQKEGECKVFISFIEVYQEACYDLLDQDKRLKKLEEWDKIQTKEDSNGELSLEGVRVYECESEESALSLLFLGNMNRITSSTKMNMASVSGVALGILLCGAAKSNSTPIFLHPSLRC